MADYIVIPPARQVRGTVAVPPSKSATNRALVLAALSEKEVEIEGPLVSEDTRALVRCLTAMGAGVAASPIGLRVRGPLGVPAGFEVILDAGESGTAARFLAAVAAATPGRFLLTGSQRLRERPIGELVLALRSCGARIEYAEEEERLPIQIAGGTLRSGRVAVDASRSSQFLSALLLVGPALPDGLEVSSTGAVASAPYVATTLECVRAFGHEVIGDLPRPSADSRVGPIRVTRGREPAERYRVPGDYSSALPLLCCAGMVGGSAAVTGLVWPSGDADAGALAVLESMGLEIEASAEAITARSRGALRPVTAAATDFPDAVPALAAVAARAPGRSVFEGIAHLRWKESDRIAAIASLLTAAGADAQALPDGVAVEGRTDLPARGPARKLPTFGDHRIAMAAALLSLALPDFLIENPACVAKSYPRFFADLETLLIR